MEENKKYLNEESYKKVKKGLIFVAIMVLIIGLSIGGFLITTGINKNKNVDKTSQAELAEDPAKLNNIENQIIALNKEKLELDKSTSKEFMKNGFTDKYYDESAKKTEISTKIMNLSSEKAKITMGFDKISVDYEKTGNSIYFFIGFFVIGASLMISGFIMIIAFRRNVMAFGVQQVMPVAKETIEEIAPTIGKAAGTVMSEMAKEVTPIMKDVVKEVAPVYGDVAKEIAKGIKEGLKDEDKQE